jgi:hypothetical protein
MIKDETRIIDLTVGELKQLFKKNSEDIINEIKIQVIDKIESRTKLLTRKEAACLLRMSLGSLNTYSYKRGIIPCHKIGNHVLYKEHECLESLTQVKLAKYKKGVDVQ